MLPFSKNFSRAAFLQLFHGKVACELYDPSLSAVRISRLLGMSRTDLHRKVRLAVGMSITQYVRFLRVQHAKSMMRAHPEWPLCHIGYESGFNSPSYFTRVFKSVEGICPLDFRRRHYLEHM